MFRTENSILYSKLEITEMQRTLFLLINFMSFFQNQKHLNKCPCIKKCPCFLVYREKLPLLILEKLKNHKAVNPPFCHRNE